MATNPQGSLRLDLHFARLMALTANIHRGKATPAFKPGDFLLDTTPKKPQTTLDMKNQFLRAVIASGGKVITKGK